MAQRRRDETQKSNSWKFWSFVIDIAIRVLVPILYLYLWYAIPALILGKDKLDITWLTILALPVLFVGVISKQTSWSIGGEGGIRGDNIGKRVKATVDRKGSLEFQGIEMGDEKIKDMIGAVTNNTPSRSS